MRATKTNGCGVVVLGPTNAVVSEGFVSVGLTANNQEGEAIEVVNAAGNVCVSDTPPPKFLNYAVEIAFCGVDPELVNLLTGQPLVMNAAGTTAVGFRVESNIDVTAIGFALELWTGVPADTCAGGTTQYGYILLPFIKGGTLGDITVANAAVDFTLTGATTRNGAGWGVGIYNVVRNASNVAAPLATAIGTKTHLHTEVTTVAPPTAACGAVAVGVPATTAIAGTPGTFSPANSYPPANFAALPGGLTASPATNWTTGQHIILRDGSLAHWNGTAWVAGAKP